MRSLSLPLLAALLAALLAPAASALSLHVPSADVSLDTGSLDARLATGIADAELRLDARLPSLLTDPARLFEAPEPAIAIERGVAPEPTLPPRAEPESTPEVATAGAALLWILLERLGATRAVVGAIAALYSRLGTSDLLENERRDRVLSMVRAKPGIGPQEIADNLGTGWGVTSYHLDRLERAGLLTSQRVGHARAYFVPGSVPREAQRTRAIVRHETTRRIATLVHEKPGLTQSELCGALGLSASAASKQISRLEEAALVRREPAAHGVRVFPAPTLSAALS